MKHKSERSLEVALTDTLFDLETRQKCYGKVLKYTQVLETRKMNGRNVSSLLMNKLGVSKGRNRTKKKNHFYVYM